MLVLDLTVSKPFSANMSSPDTLPSPALGQVAITVADVGKAVAFYRDILGLTFLFSPNENLAFLQAGEVRPPAPR